MKGITHSMLLLCLLLGLTSANTSPTIQQSVYQVCEDIPKDTYAFTINATDKENDPLTYSITDVNSPFQVETNTGNISVIRPLDRETTNIIILHVTVSDGLNTIPGRLTIIILDANDNQPIFQNAPYDVQVLENTTVGTSLFKAQASDDDSGTAGAVQYSIQEVTPSNGFDRFSIVSNTGEVKLNGTLNFTQSTFYRLKIIASDGGGHCHFDEPKFYSSTAFSFVTVVDVPDLDPIFVGLPYVGRVQEMSPLGTSVFTVTAIDQDTDINDEIIFSIKNSSAEGLFEISPAEGIITVSSNIDREAIGNVVDLTVKATESKLNIHGIYASAEANVQIEIVDINDNPPEFYKCGDEEDELSCVRESHFTAEVLEHSLGSVFINMTVRDLDRFSKTKLTLEGADKDVFSVEPPFTTSDSIVQLMVKQPQELDFEITNQMVLQVIAVDEEDTTLRSTATVTINIKDDNDNSPVFAQDTYKLTVPEHSPVGTILDNITAEDPDTMDEGNITYKLLPDSIRLYFDVEKYTGSVYVKNETLLDREVRALYSATLEARDTDNKPGNTVLEITLTDINDQPPVINRESYQEFVKEGEELKLKIQATDTDDPDTENSQIVFAILPSQFSDNFTIDPNTGVLTNRGELDREALDPKLDGKIVLNVTATDKGHPPLSTMVTVTINVDDINDNKPHFEASSYKFSVKEGEKGAFVGSVVAEDFDQTTEFNRLTFSVEGGFGSFGIRTFAADRGYSGNISVDRDIELDYERAPKQFKLQVEVADTDDFTAQVTVDVEVLDVNDERPEFKPIAPVKVKENTTISWPVGNFTAHDLDGNHSLVYELESMKCRCNSSLTPCSWFTLEPTGEVRLNPEETVDYEKCDQVVIEAQVVDEYTEKGENNSVTPGQMVINIEDINDNAPQFIISDVVSVVVSESASKGTSVARVTATDRDSEPNRQIEFKVTKVEFQYTNNEIKTMNMLFEAPVSTQQGDTYVGIIQTTGGLDMSEKGKYLVTVNAIDSGGLYTSTVMEIFKIDVSYKVELAFRDSRDEVEKKINEIQGALQFATKANVNIGEIMSKEPETTRAVVKTIVEAYFVYNNGTAMTPVEVELVISDPENRGPLIALGLADIGAVEVIEPKNDPWTFALLGMLAGLLIVLAVLTTSLMCTRRNYRRKLKAAKAMNSASMVTSDNQKSGPVVPGTNKYTMEGANPVLNLNIDTTMVLDMDDESSDVDKVSLNSLDYSEDMSVSVKENPMHMIQEEEEDDDSGPPKYIEPLGAALAQRGQKKNSGNPRAGYDNPAFSTTDL
ncbi:cadherin-related family member 2 [Centropristis striata]|uniref:cadherin-related family member 2 n=1 Tax=Centropristis striata TaxID=184440 RepID=UPI0027E1ADC7|nr:cadherin-related family member 2 [Centropristis striata]